MPEEQFIKYVGDHRIHDSVIEGVCVDGAEAVVLLRTFEGAQITCRFTGVVEVDNQSAEGMMVYALAEMKNRGEGRRFLFSDSHDGEEEGQPERELVIVADEVTVEDTT